MWRLKAVRHKSSVSVKDLEEFKQKRREHEKGVVLVLWWSVCLVKYMHAKLSVYVSERDLMCFCFSPQPVCSPEAGQERQTAGQ